MSKIQIGRGAVYLYIENISSMILGYAFWLILSRMISPETVGISSSYISFAMIFISIASIGVPLGAQRFLGRMFAEKRFEDAMVFVKSSFFIVSLGLSASTLIILGSGYIFFDHFRFILIVASMVLIVISTVSILLRSIFIASLNTKKVLLASTISSAIKLIVAVILVSLGTGEVGVLISFAVAPLITSTILVLDLRALLKQASKMTLVRFSDSLRLLLKSSVVSWIPLSIEALGTQLGNNYSTWNSRFNSSRILFYRLSNINGNIRSHMGNRGNGLSCIKFYGEWSGEVCVANNKGLFAHFVTDFFCNNFLFD